MKREVGIWIDHYKAVMVTVVNEEEETREIRSNIEKHVILRPGKHPKDPNVSTISGTEDMGDRRYENHLIEYYDGVVSLLRNADSIWIFGPGEAKNEFKKRLDREDLGGRIISIDTVDKMTDRQIAAKVRQHYEF